jgi:hypothetical protein
VKNAQAWRASEYELRGGHWRSARNAAEVAVGSQITDAVARVYAEHLPQHARGRLLDLRCGHVPLYGAYRPWVSEVTCVDWADGAHLVSVRDPSQPLRSATEARFVRLNGLLLLALRPLRGVVDVQADLLAKVPLAGAPLALAMQARAFGGTAVGARVAAVSSRHFPLGHFLVAQCVAPDPA